MASSRLQQELKKKRPFELLEEEASLNVLRTNDQIQIRFSRLFREHELTPSQYNVLRILRGEGKPLPILEIASRTITVVPGITGLVDRLEQAGLVIRKRCSEDRRVIFVALTDQGSAALARLDQPVRELQQQTMRGLSAPELRELNGLLEKLREGMAPAGQ